MGIVDFFVRLWNSLFHNLKSEYEKLSTDEKAKFDLVFTVTNIFKANVGKPGAALLQLIEQAIGPDATNQIAGVLKQTAISLNIDVTNVSDPATLAEMIAGHFKDKQGDAWKDAALSLSTYLFTYLIGPTITREVAIPLVSFVYDEIFKKNQS
jgi:hypothetical protein